MDGHARPAELPELRECLASVQVRFRRPESRHALERSTTGWLTDRPHKNCDPLAQAVPGTSAQRLQECLTNMAWDEAELNRQRVQKMSAEATRGHGVSVFGETGFPTQGQTSGGVARRYSGTLGQVGNGQIAVTGCDTARRATWPVAVQGYLPKTWASEAARRQQARGPAEISCQTTPAIARRRLDQAPAWGGPHGGVAADADDGDHPHVWAGLAARQEPPVVAGRTAFPVRWRRGAPSRVWRGDARRQTVPRWPWRPGRWRRGAKGWWRKQLVAGRRWRLPSDGQGHEGGLLGERATRGQPEERQDCRRDLPVEATRDERAGLAPRRPALEPCHEEAKGEWGWDHDQGRLGPGFHRPAVTVMLAYRLRVWRERRQRRRHQRQGRLGDLGSPSAAAPPPDSAGGPS